MQFIPTPLIEGFFLGAGLIIAIGAQNAFILKQGLKKQHLFMTAFTCFVSDAILIILGVKGVGLLIAEDPLFYGVLRWGGAFFLIFYGLRSFWNAFHPRVLIADLASCPKNTLATFVTLLGFTFLNPHTYIDAFLLLGTFGAERPANEHFSFICGVLVASFIWFFGLTYGASILSPLFKKPRAWQILDTLMGFMMIGIGVVLIL